MRKLMVILFAVIALTAFGQANNGKFEMLIHKPNSNVQLFNYNCWIDQTTLGNWATIIDGEQYISNTFQQALQVFFITKLKKIRTFTIGNNVDTLLQVIYWPKSQEYSVIVRNNYAEPFMFDKFYDTNDLNGRQWPPTSVRGMVMEVIIESVREGILYYE